MKLLGVQKDYNNTILLKANNQILININIFLRLIDNRIILMNKTKLNNILLNTIK